jgi:hypothetical protein
VVPEPFVEPTIDEGNVVEIIVETEMEPTWYPHPKYNVSSLDSFESRTDLNSYADTTVLGKHCMIVYNTNCTADVSPFLPELGTAEKIRIITGASTYDHPNGETIILIVNQALYIPALHDNLVCDNHSVACMMSSSTLAPSLCQNTQLTKHIP